MNIIQNPEATRASGLFLLNSRTRLWSVLACLLIYLRHFASICLFGKEHGVFGVEGVIFFDGD